MVKIYLFCTYHFPKKMTLRSLLVLILLYCPLLAKDQPNVIIVLSDDQGYGDFGCKGNPLIKTPNIDAMASRSFEMKRFYVSPVCSPTRASLMTGRDYYRTGVTDTWLGRSTLRASEVTLAEMLKNAGYSTSLFGKWHLGDTYPCRPMDQGFDHALYLAGGGLGQPSDPIENNNLYTNPYLFENGKKIQAQGFCCDVYFDEAIQWLKKQKANKQPFFAYIATNTPHAPYHDVPQKWLDYYSKLDLSPKNFPQTQGHPIAAEHFKQDDLARIYAMISNIDDNMGKLFQALKQEDLYHDTIVIYFTDNGPNTLRYVGGFADKKGSHKEGGIRSPIWWHWPNRFKAGASSDLLSAHIDIMPTLAELCGAKLPEDRHLDGQSIAKTLLGGRRISNQNNLFIQWHRGDKPEAFNNTAIVQQNWKIEAHGEKTALYHMKEDPFALRDVSAQYPEITSRLSEDYRVWLNHLNDEYPNMWDPVPLEINLKEEPEIILTHQEWRNMEGKNWSKSGSNGEWLLNLNEEATFNIRFNLLEAPPVIKASLQINQKTLAEGSLKKENHTYLFKSIVLPKGQIILKIEVETETLKTGPWQVFLSSDQK